MGQARGGTADLADPVGDMSRYNGKYRELLVRKWI